MIKKLIILNTIVFLFLFYSCSKGSPNNPLTPPAVLPTYTITFSLNGGSGTEPSSITGHLGEKINLPNQNSMTSPDHLKKFGGWSNPLSSETYNGGEEYTITSDATLEANWTSKSVSEITFNLNGGNINGVPSTIAPQEVMEGEYVGKPAVQIQKSASKFIDKWYTESSCTTEWDFSAAITSSTPQKITLYAGYKDLTIISAANDLIDLAEIVKNGDNLLGKTITLQNDIDLTGSSFNGIAVGGGSFAGTFDGGNNTITGLNIVHNGDDVGFIGKTTGAAVVKNVIIEGGSIEGNANVASIVGNNEGFISGCANIGGIIQGKNWQYGGIAGVNSSTGIIEKCYNTALIKGGNWAGGIVGANKGYIRNCYNTGKIESSNNSGGIVGHNNVSETTSKVQNCYNIGQTTAGGIIGLSIYPNAENCYYLNGTGNSRQGTTSKTSSGFILTDFSGWDTSIWKQKDFGTALGSEKVANRPVLIGIGPEGQ